MPRQGKQLNIWIPDDVMASLEHWVSENQTTKTVRASGDLSHGIIQAIQVLTGTHPEAPPELRSQVQALTTAVEQLQQQLDQLENQTVWSLQKRLDATSRRWRVTLSAGFRQRPWRPTGQQMEGELWDLHPEVISVLRELGTTLEEATRDQLRQVCKQLGIKINTRWSQEKLKQELQSWQPVTSLAGLRQCASGDLSH